MCTVLLNAFHLYFETVSLDKLILDISINVCDFEYFVHL